MEKESPIKVGEVVQAEVKRHNNLITITGVVKDIRTSYGQYEYYVTNTRTNCFWARSLKKVNRLDD